MSGTGPVTGQAAAGGVSVEVTPGGALRGLRLTPDALRLGPTALAEAVLTQIRVAAARANQRSRHELGEQLHGLRDEEIDRLGLAEADPGDPGVAEQSEATTPDTWRV